MSDSDDENPYDALGIRDFVKARYDINNNQSEDDEKEELAKVVPPHCSAYEMIKPDESKRRRDPEPTRVISPEECFEPCPRIIKREQWGARLPKIQPDQMMFRVRAAVFKKSDCYNCSDEFNCSNNVRLLQMYQMDYLGFSDIAYNFMIGEDGNVYEGRGWGAECEKARGFMGIGFIGYYTDEGKTRPSDEMLQLAYDLIMCGVRKGFVANPFTMWGSGQSPLEMMREYIENEEDVDYTTKVEDPGIY